ncbi:MAG: MMPL family transporter [Nitrospinota bacterium]|nr:MMPL family transporter [Nitrospinota bacterium]
MNNHSKTAVKHKNFKDKILKANSAFVCKHPYLIFISSILLALLSIHYTINTLKFLTNRNDLISPQAKYYRDYQKFRLEFKNYDGLIIVIEGPDERKIKDFADNLADFLNSEPENFQDVYYKIDANFFKSKKLLFLSPDDLHALENKIKSNSSFIHSFIKKPGLESFFKQVNKEINKAMVGTLISDFFGGNEKIDRRDSKNPLDLSMVESILEQMLAHSKGANDFSSNWNNFFIKKKSDVDEDGYLTSYKKKFYYIFVNPSQNQSDFARAVGPINSVRNYIKELQNKYPGVTAGVTGPTALASDEMVTSSNDMVKASLLSLAGVSLLFIISLKRFTLPIIAIFTLVISLCLSLGFTTLTVGHLNILSIVFTTVLIGLGIDFGIHFIMRFQEEERLRNNVTDSITNSLIGTGKGVIAGAITTSFAFMATIFTDFKGIAELGFIAGTGIIICLIATITLLPAMIIIIENLKTIHWIEKFSKKITVNYSLSEKTIHPIFDILLKKPRYIIFLGSFTTFLTFLVIKDIRFDYNILNLQASGLESVDYEMRILNNSDRSAWYGAVIVNTYDKVLSTKKAIESLPSVNIVSSVASIVPEQQQEKISIIKRISSLFSKFPPSTNNDSYPVNLDNLSKILKKIYFKMRSENMDSWEQKRKPEAGSINNIRKLISDFNYLVRQQKKTSIEKNLNNYQTILFSDFNNKLNSFKDALNPKEIMIKDIPENLKERFIGKTGKFLLQVFPKVNIYDRKPMEEFLSDIRSIDPNVTGSAVTASESSRLMKEGYIRGGIFALIAIIIFIWISFRNCYCVLLAILPLALGSFWTLGLMGLFNLQFNLANLVILPLIIGIGVDNGIHIVHRYRDTSGSMVSPVYTSTGKAVILSSLTTMVGFGSLMVASHRGIHSIGVLLTLGVGCCMIASITVLPAILKSARQKGWTPKPVPST